MVLRKILDKLSLSAIRHRLDRRRLQEELDLHRLYLLSSYYSVHLQEAARGAVAAGDSQLDQLAEKLNAEAQQLGLDGTKLIVQQNLGRQLESICNLLHNVLESAGDSIAAQRLDQQTANEQAALKQEPLGFGRAFHADTAASQQQQEQQQPNNNNIQPTSLLSQAAYSELFAKTHGFTLNIAQSACPQPEAGDGVWISGQAQPGQIVAMYPGVAYPPLFHRNIPGYPLVAKTNSYLQARFDGVVLDGKPWGQGWSGKEQAQDEALPWPASRQNAAEVALTTIEGRNPVAFAHIVNHPPAGTAPNVAVAAVDFILKDSKLRPYIPIINYEDIADSAGNASKTTKPIPGTVLVASRPLSNEELYLNYRLNPNTPSGLPHWYSPVDAEEDLRRWS